MSIDQSSIYEIIREDLNRVEEVWSRSEFIDNFMSFECDDCEGEECQESIAHCHCDSVAVGDVILGTYYGVLMCFGSISRRTPGDNRGALALAKGLLSFLGGLVEFIEVNSDRFVVDEYYPEDAVGRVNEVISCLERVRGNLRMLINR